MWRFMGVLGGKVTRVWEQKGEKESLRVPIMAVAVHLSQQFVSESMPVL